MEFDLVGHARRLDSWKSIAQHLDYSVRTVQRWHTKYGLPIHHLSGSNSTAFAFSEELDEWIKNRDLPPEDNHSEFSTARSSPPAPTEADCIKADDPNESSFSQLRSFGLLEQAGKMWEILTPSNIEAIARVYREAIELDSNNAHAFAGLALALITKALMNGITAPSPYEAANFALSRAIEIDPEIEEVDWAKAWLKMAIQRDWEGARRLFDCALNKSRLFRSALIGRGLLFIAAGQLQKASEHLLEASNLNPLNTPAAALMCWNSYLSGEYERTLYLIEHARGSGHHGNILDGVEALSLVQSSRSDAYQRIGSLAAEPSRGYIVQGILGYIYGISGQVESARLIVDSLKRRAMGRRCFHPYAIALPLIGLNEVEEAIGWLEESYRIGSIWSLGFSSDPILASLRGTSHYQSLMTRINYPAPECSAL